MKRTKKELEEENQQLHKCVGNMAAYLGATFCQHVERKDQNSINKAYYPWIPMGSAFILEILLKLKQNFPKLYSFLDIGAGPGNVMLIARAAGFHTKGIEVDESYTQNLPMRMNIEICDAFKYTAYSCSDLLYAYCPIRESKLMQELLEYITNRTKPGQMFLYFQTNSAKPSQEKWTQDKILPGYAYSSAYIYTRK